MMMMGLVASFVVSGVVVIGNYFTDASGTGIYDSLIYSFPVSIIRLASVFLHYASG